MKYWSESESGNENKVFTEEQITKASVLKNLAVIKRGHIPDWNYETHAAEKEMSLPGESYPLHVALTIAMEAVNAQDEEFFKRLDDEYAKKQEDL